MKLLKDLHIFNGLEKDVSMSKLLSNILYDAHNIRITAREGETALSITNERGPALIDLKFGYKNDEGNWIELLDNGEQLKLEGKYIGSCILNNYIVIFTYIKETKLAIYRIDVDEPKYNAFRLYKGNLNMDMDHSLETIVSYENDFILKVYWVDGKNLPRLINISPYNDNKINLYNSDYFNFFTSLDLKEKVTITKNYQGGVFHSGVIQYAFTYYNKYMLETSIFYVSPLYYICFLDRGASPEDTCSTSFNINIDNLDNHYEYLRIYSIHRTSLNATPLCKRVTDINISENKNLNSILFVDSGSTGDTIDPTELLYKSSEPIIANSICLKDNTLFFGNYSLQRLSIPSIIKKELTPLNKDKKLYNYELVLYNVNYRNIDNNYNFHLDGANCARFRYDEYYRFGVLFLYKTGIWSEPIWIGDTTINKCPNDEAGPGIKWCLNNNDVILNLKNAGYKKIRGLIALPTWNDRNIKFQGVANPTVFRNIDRYATENDAIDGSSDFNFGDPSKGILYGLASWLWRPAHNNFKELTYTQYVNRNNKYSNIYPASVLFWDLNYCGKLVWRHGMHIPSDYELIACKYNIAASTGTTTYILNEYCSSHILFLTLVNYYNNNKSEWDRLAKEKLPGLTYKRKHFHRHVAKGITDGDENYFRSHIYDDEGRNDLISILNDLNLYNARVIYNNQEGANATLVAYKPFIPASEFEGIFTLASRFRVDNSLFTLHSPDIIFDEFLLQLSFNKPMLELIGSVNIYKNYGYMELLTSSPPIGTNGKGFNNIGYSCSGLGSLIGIERYNDTIADDPDTNINNIKEHPDWEDAYYWPLYMWQRNGSINNDVERANRSAVLKTKKISNYRLSYTNIDSVRLYKPCDRYCDLIIVNSSEPVVTKINGYFYLWNIDTMLTPESSPIFFWTNKMLIKKKKLFNDIYGENALTSDFNHYFCELLSDGNGIKVNGLTGDFGDKFRGLCEKGDSIRLKYKTTPHAIVYYSDPKILGNAVSAVPNPFDWVASDSPDEAKLPLYNVKVSLENIYGGKSELSLKENIWIPASEPVNLDNAIDGKLYINFIYGDTYFLQYECLKTYPFTFEDPNLVTDILLFSCESHICLDGRYDRNRGQSKNITVSPVNYNLLNLVYSLLDNFFTYKILNKDYYEISQYPNLVVWSTEKILGADTDNYTHVTLASVYDMDGSKGNINKLTVWNNNIFCFLDLAVSNIIFNPRVLLQTTDNVPIEIGNSYKVEGKRLITDGSGCTNKFTVATTPNGIYFVDSITLDLYHIGSETLNISKKTNMTMYFDSIPKEESKPNNFTCKVFSDATNNDLYINTKETSLCFSEVLSHFTSYYDYNVVEDMFNCTDKFFAIRNIPINVHTRLLYIFKRAATKPKIPIGGNYTEAPDGWLYGMIKPNASINDKLWVSKGYVSDFYIDIDWSEPEEYLMYANTGQYKKKLTTVTEYSDLPDSTNKESLWEEPLLDNMENYCWEAISYKLKDGSYSEWKITGLLANNTPIVTLGWHVDLYLMWKGEPNNFFGIYKPYDITYISNGRNELQDTSQYMKTFTNVSYKADRYIDKLHGNLAFDTKGYPKLIFDYIRVFNEYLDTTQISLTNTNRISNIKLKFRQWNIDIPRDKKSTYKRNRILNLWCKVQLGIYQDLNNPNTDLMELHDISTTFYI